MKGNVYWLSLMEYLQLPHGCCNEGKMDFSCIEGILDIYSAITLDDVLEVTDRRVQSRADLQTNTHTHTHIYMIKDISILFNISVNN